MTSKVGLRKYSKGQGWAFNANAAMPFFTRRVVSGLLKENYLKKKCVLQIQALVQCFSTRTTFFVGEKTTPIEK